MYMIITYAIGTKIDHNMILNMKMDFKDNINYKHKEYIMNDVFIELSFRLSDY